jgi:glycosyltransferase involved in cell wall biosynthesis
MQMGLTFSIVVPSYQQARFLSKNFESLAQQGVENLEVIVQDGGSTDGSVDIIRKWEKHSWKSFKWESKRDKGQTDAINQGLKKATGDIVSFLNSDDYLLPNALKTVERYFEQNPDLQMLYGKALHVNEDGKTIGEYPTEKWSLSRLLETCLICQPACFWRRKLHDKIGLFDESLNYGMDLDFWLRAGKITEPFYVTETLAASRCHSEAKRFAHVVAMRQETLNIICRHNKGKAPAGWVTGLARAHAEKHLQKSFDSAHQFLFCMEYWRRFLTMLYLIDAKNSPFSWRKLMPPLKNAIESIQDPFANLKNN